MARLNEGYGYGQLELNQFAAPRDGRIEAQLPLDAEVFHKGTTAADDVPAEVGMVLKVDKANKKITAAIPAEFDVYALNYSTEHMYDERTPQLRNFRMYPADKGYDFTGHDDFYPRMGFFALSDRFTTNTVELNGAKFDNTIVGKKAYVGEDGYWWIEAAQNYGPVAEVVEKTTMPDGAPAVKLMIVRA